MVDWTIHFPSGFTLPSYIRTPKNALLIIHACTYVTIKNVDTYLRLHPLSSGDELCCPKTGFSYSLHQVSGCSRTNTERETPDTPYKEGEGGEGGLGRGRGGEEEERGGVGRGGEGRGKGEAEEGERRNEMISDLGFKKRH